MNRLPFRLRERDPLARASLVLAAVVLAVGAASIVALQVRSSGDGGPRFHEHGEGPLSDGGTGDGSWSLALDPGRWQGMHTFATRLCLTDVDAPATIVDVRPNVAIGSDFRLLGAVVRDFEVSLVDHPMGGADGYPPSVPDPLVPAIGFQVTQSCDDARQPYSRYVELMVGLEGTGPGGGGWRGEEIEYTVGAQRYVLVLHTGWLICGTATENLELCARPAAGSSPTTAP